MNIQSISNTQQYYQAILQQQQKLPGQQFEWLRNIRDTSLQSFHSSGFPTIRLEDWKYTNVEALTKRSFKLVDKQQSIALTLDQIQPWLIPDLACHRLVFVNGYYHAALSNVLSLPQNTVMMDLATALQQNSQRISSLLAQIAVPAQHGFTALNHALLREGIYIQVPKNVVLEQPVHCIFVSLPSEQISWSQPHNLIEVEAGGHLKLIETYINLGGDTEYFTNAITEISLEPQAQVEHIKIQDESIHAFHVGTTFARLARDSHFISHSLGLGGKLVRSDTHVKLCEIGASCELNGLYCVQGHQHMDHHTTIEHIKPHGTSREFYRGIATDHGRAVFNGKVIVFKDAQKTDAQQENHNLLLSPDAEIDAKPQLEIYADDVKCAHGATVGQLDEEALFYFRTRGIDAETARNILKYAFAATVFEKIKNRSIRNHVLGLLQGRFPVGLDIKGDK